MGQELQIVTALHQSTKRDYLGRMVDDKVTCMEVAREYGQQFWDGERRFGYGGYKYDGRWERVARALIDQYQLAENARILDVGCGKGFLLYELQQLLPQAEVKGFDLSGYALENAKPEIKDQLFVHRAEQAYPYPDGSFDLVISLTTLHNLQIAQLQAALAEMERVAKNKYLVVESYRNPRELFNLQCWALTCEAFFRPSEWVWLFEQFGYSGDYEFIFFE
jgi:ubiquinone/menaquinone biosynthesis C-methylase UbiE